MTTPCHLGWAFRRGAALAGEAWLTTQEQDRLLSRIASRVVVNDVGCHLWQGCRRFRDEGYGAIKFRGKVWRVHRLVLAIQLGRWLRSDEVAMHRCNDPQCVNANHLEVGSQSENVQQCHDESRHAERCGLSEDDRQKIEQLNREGCSSWVMAERLHLPRSTIVGYLERQAAKESSWESEEV